MTANLSSTKLRPWAQWLRRSLIVVGAGHVAIPIPAADIALAYDRKDAGYVTSSKNPGVLDYIVCLEKAVSDTPKSMSLPASLDDAEKKCSSQARKLPKTASEPNADDIRSMVLECGFRVGGASPDMGCDLPPKQAQQQAAPRLPKQVSTQPQSAPARQYRLSEAEQSAIQAGIRTHLKDPTSPLFGGMEAARGDNGLIYVCGMVNAKNSYGGYTGDQPYFGMLIGDAPRAAFAVVGFGGTLTESRAILSACKEHGVF
ncbi:hypothetical protein [Rhizobium ruizarguesonis]|uniref:hypothetical protein n=1 Tax=Rhizobium TaxID=379 RepID=UPI001031DE32|nr:hypothetical protein [Rhizobium ruizarguesonis]TBA44388.1 hypothetical protein ELH62_19330 [Rhizobium ruizarguesonis]TBD65473.1 hypothetical protein ELH22_20165 [Rhizobium ruizarguesonis]